MGSAPVPMNRTARRKQKLPPTLEETPLMVIFVRREVKTFPDGSEATISYFAPVTPSGHPLLEDDTPDGPVPVMLASVPIVVKRPSAILTGPSLVRR